MPEINPNTKSEKYIFLDRDGTIIEDKGYVHKISDLKFMPKAISGLKNLKKLGYKLVILSNQAGVAKNYYTMDDAHKFNKELVSRLAKKDIKIEDILICPHHPDITGKCKCRKPNTGLADIAAKKFKIDLSRSIFIGDKNCDIELGKSCGGKTFLIDNNQYEVTVLSDYKVKNILEVSAELRKLA